MNNKQSQSTSTSSSEETKCLHLVHSAKVTSLKLLNPHQRESIATRCLIHRHSRWTVMREYGTDISTINDICDQAMYERGVQAGRNAERFSPKDSPRTQRRAA